MKKFSPKTHRQPMIIARFLYQMS